MALPTRPSARRRALAIIAAAATTASGAALLGPGTSSASSHREAPYVQGDPVVDNTDTYAFVSPNDPNMVTMIASWSPLQEPAGGPTFFPWDTTAAYDINIDNDGDAKADLVYRWTFKDQDTSSTVDRGAGNGGKGTFLYADGPVTSPDDENLRHKQTYDVAVFSDTAATKTIVSNGKVAPSNVGKATMPDYPSDLRAASVVKTTDGGRSYVGQTDDAFYLDLRVFDLLYGGNLGEVGYDTLSGYNVNSVALELPKDLLVAAGDAKANPVIGVWSTTSRQRNRVFKENNAATTTGVEDSSDATNEPAAGGVAGSEFVQVSRLGNPLVNEVVVPRHLKDFYNRSTPDTDTKFLGKVQDPEVPALIEAIYKVSNPNKLDNPAAAKRNDLVGTFLTGFSKSAFAGDTFGGAAKGVVDADLNSLDLNAVSPNPVPAEYLRLNVNVPPLSPGKKGYSNLGVIGGDLSGYPNGRRLNDDITDITLRVAEGTLLRPAGDPFKPTVDGLGDAVSANDKPFLTSFPFITDPHSGSDPRKGTTPVSFFQNFSNSNGVVSAQATRLPASAKGGIAQLVRTNRNGSQTQLAKVTIGGASTTVIKVNVPRFTNVVLYWRILLPTSSAVTSSNGVPTTVSSQ